jgi:hypothetical protein
VNPGGAGGFEVLHDLRRFIRIGVLCLHGPPGRVGAGGDKRQIRPATGPANHWSSRTGRNRRMALWLGFMPTTSAYFAGDTAYGNGRIFWEIRRRTSWKRWPSK